MYHIPQDKRAYKSADSIYESLLNVLERKKLADVTVTDINKESQVSRATFYRLFDNVSDVLIWKCNLLMDESIKKAKANKNLHLQDAFVLFGSSWMENKRMLASLIKNNRMDILTNLHAERMNDIARIFVHDEKMSDLNKECMASLLANIMPSAFQIWILHPKMSAIELFEVVRENLYQVYLLFSK